MVKRQKKPAEAGRRTKLTISLSEDDIELIRKQMRETGAYTISEVIKNGIRAAERAAQEGKRADAV